MNRFQMMSDSPGGRIISQISAAYGSMDRRPCGSDKKQAPPPFPQPVCHDSLRLLLEEDAKLFTPNTN